MESVSNLIWEPLYFGTDKVGQLGIAMQLETGLFRDNDRTSAGMEPSVIDSLGARENCRRRWGGGGGEAV